MIPPAAGREATPGYYRPTTPFSRARAKGLPLAGAVGDGETAVAAEGAGGDLDAGRGLPPLVLVAVHHADHAPHRLFGEAHRQDVGKALVLLHVGLDDGVEDLVGGQRLLVHLVGPQLGGGRLGHAGLGDDRPSVAGVPVLRQLVDEGLGGVFDDGVAAGHVAVEGGVAGGHLALVAGGEHEPAELVGEPHEDVAADTRLQVLLGDAGLGAGELFR